jgi:hypothetical protein
MVFLRRPPKNPVEALGFAQAATLKKICKKHLAPRRGYEMINVPRKNGGGLVVPQ